MPTSKPELKLRHHLNSHMTGKWLMTYHEDREITPGVPDLHYSMGPTDRYHLGWLELKALDTDITGSNRIKVEASQHQYIRKWANRMIIHFLIRVRDTLYVVESGYHGCLPEIDNNRELAVIAVTDGVFHQDQVADRLPTLLKEFTAI